MAENVVNPRQWKNVMKKRYTVGPVGAETESIPAMRQRNEVTGETRTAMRASELAKLPNYDLEDETALREDKRARMSFDPALAESIRTEGVRTPVDLGTGDPFSMLRKPSMLTVMNGNHRITAALDNDPSQWVPIRRGMQVHKSQPWESYNKSFVNKYGRDQAQQMITEPKRGDVPGTFWEAEFDYYANFGANYGTR